MAASRAWRTLHAFAALFACTAGTVSAAPEHFTLKNKRAIVTGGSRGLGRAVVEELLSQGAYVTTCARDLEPLKDLLAKEPRCGAVVADVSTEEGRAALMAEMRRLYGEEFALDILVNNVGTNLRKHSAEYTTTEYSWLQKTNQESAFMMSTACFEALVRASGCVINVSSVSGSTVDNTGAPYHMAKAALEHMTRYLACEWGPRGVRVNAVAPWFVATPLTTPLLSKRRFAAAVRRATPLRRWGEPHEVACVVAFLAMPASSYVTGAVVGIDGGMLSEGFRYP